MPEDARGLADATSDLNLSLSPDPDKGCCPRILRNRRLTTLQCQFLAKPCGCLQGPCDVIPPSPGRLSGGLPHPRVPLRDPSTPGRRAPARRAVPPAAPPSSPSG